MLRLGGLAGVAVLALSACAIEVGPPPASDPPLVPDSAKGPPPPAQPTEPQAWSRDLDFGKGPLGGDSEELEEGLVAANTNVSYSSQRLTYQSAFDEEKQVSEAEKARQRARERAEAAGLPAIAAAPVDEVSQQSLPPADGEAGQQRESRLPPPPKFPPVAPKDPQVAAADGQAPLGEEAAVASDAEAAGSDPRWENSRLPPPPKFPTTLNAPAEAPVGEATPGTSQQAAPEDVVTDAGSPEAPPAAEAAPTTGAAVEAPEAPAQQQDVAAVSEPAASSEPAPVPQQTAAVPQAAGDFMAATWDAPPGTILVQVSAVQEKASVPVEWQRLQGRFPQELSALRLVIDEAKLGDRGVFYRVQAGGFGSQEGAVAACDDLISQGQACFVVVR